MAYRPYTTTPRDPWGRRGVDESRCLRNCCA